MDVIGNMLRSIKICVYLSFGGRMRLPEMKSIVGFAGLEKLKVGKKFPCEGRIGGLSPAPGGRCRAKRARIWDLNSV